MREKAQNRGQSGITSHRHCKDTAKEGSLIPPVLEGTELHCRERVLTPPSTQVHTQTQMQKGQCSCQGESMGIEASGTNKRRKKTAQSPGTPRGCRTCFSMRNQRLKDRTLQVLRDSVTQRVRFSSSATQKMNTHSTSHLSGPSNRVLTQELRILSRSHQHLLTAETENIRFSYLIN